MVQSRLRTVSSMGLITGDNTTIDGLVRVNAQFINTNPNSYLLNYIAYSKRVNGSDPVNYPSKGFGIFDGSIKLAGIDYFGTSAVSQNPSFMDGLTIYSRGAINLSANKSLLISAEDLSIQKLTGGGLNVNAMNGKGVYISSTGGFMSVDNDGVYLSATDSGTNINMSGNVNIYDLLNGVAIRETSNGFYLLAKTGKLNRNRQCWSLRRNNDKHQIYRNILERM